MLTFGGLFSGIGGMELGLQMAGLRHSWMCEIDPWCKDVLRANFGGEVEIYGDVRELGSARNVPRVDVLAGGFPCQDVSSAGRGDGLAGARSGLWFEFLRVVTELQPAAVIVENVASGKRKWLAQVREGLGSAGYRTRALWIRACDVGAPHLRARIFVLAVADPESGRWSAGRRSGSECGGRPDVAAGGDAPDSDGQGWQRAEPEAAEGRTVPQSGVGGAPDGIPAGLDGPAADPAPSPGRLLRWRWPAGRGQEQHPWEAPRLIRRPPRFSNRRVRLKGLGNAIVPQCAFLVALALVDWMAELHEEKL